MHAHAHTHTLDSQLWRLPAFSEQWRLFLPLIRTYAYTSSILAPFPDPNAHVHAVVSRFELCCAWEFHRHTNSDSMVECCLDITLSYCQICVLLAWHPCSYQHFLKLLAVPTIILQVGSTLTSTMHTAMFYTSSNFTPRWAQSARQKCTPFT